MKGANLARRGSLGRAGTKCHSQTCWDLIHNQKNTYSTKLELPRWPQSPPTDGSTWAKSNLEFRQNQKKIGQKTKHEDHTLFETMKNLETRMLRGLCVNTERQNRFKDISENMQLRNFRYNIIRISCLFSVKSYFARLEKQSSKISPDCKKRV